MSNYIFYLHGMSMKLNGMQGNKAFLKQSKSSKRPTFNHLKQNLKWIILSQTLCSQRMARECFHNVHYTPLHLQDQIFHQVSWVHLFIFFVPIWYIKILFKKSLTTSNNCKFKIPHSRKTNYTSLVARWFPIKVPLL